ncbi:MAG: SusC/RagA family TonB-linked outer membrane protein [Ignavibacteriae bacterium]|nr:MAG: SusC/RagA family TonB-linked outer membrane protein [Ignavibacteriota bacterium]
MKEISKTKKIIQNIIVLFTVIVFSTGMVSTKLCAQQMRTVSGTVTDAETGASLFGASILVVGTTVGTSTNKAGEYKLKLPNNAKTLRFSYIGYKTQLIEIGTLSQIDVDLVPDVANLEEVVVVGYGTTKVENLTGAISTLDVNKIKNRPLTNAGQALAGLTSGVYLNQTSGQPGKDNPTIRIRGVGTLGNNNPLVLIDGVVGRLDLLNPNDIESYTVLKDASSAAIYGSRAANGVILITTKSGAKGISKGKTFNVTYDTYFGVQEATKLPEPVTSAVEFMELYNIAMKNEGKNPAYSEEVINEFKNGNNKYLYPNTNWVDILFRRANIQEHNIGIAGSGSGTNYALSLKFLDHEGILINTNQEKYSLRTNIESQISSRLKLSGRFSGVFQDYDEPIYGTTGTIRTGFRATPLHVPYLKDGKYGGSWVAVGPQDVNPLPFAESGENNFEREYYTANLRAEFKILPELTLAGNFAANSRTDLRHRFWPEEYVYDPKTLTGIKVNYYNQRSTRDDATYVKNITAFTTLTFEKTFIELHELKAMVGYQQEETNARWNRASTEGYPNNQLHEIDAGSSNPLASGSSYRDALQSVFGRINYTFDKKYLLEGNLRYDGSSRFDENERWGLFPSFSIGWRPLQESFIPKPDFLDELKIRGSWGQLGNQDIRDADGYQLRWAYLTSLNLGQNYPLDDKVASGAAQTALANALISWESTTTTNIGFDANLFRSLGLSFDYFTKVTDGILRPIELSAMVGALNAPVKNLAEVTNKGWESTLSYDTKFGDVNFGASFNVTHVNNEVTKIDAQVISGSTILDTNYAIDSWYMYVADGIFQSQEEVTEYGAQPNAQPGDIRYKDLNGDGVINNKDKKIVGNTIPEWTFGLSIYANWNNFDFSMIWQGVQNVESMPRMELVEPFFNGAGIDTKWRNAWTPENKSTELPRLTTASHGYNHPNKRPSTFWLQDASFFRLKNIQLGYTFTQDFIKNYGFESIRLYVNANNILTITEFEGLDPERSIKQLRSDSHPNVAIWSFGLNIRL